MSSAILVLTTVYPADDLPKGYTPVVHYFAREWVKQGYDVHVIDLVSNFPKPVYWLLKVIGRRIASREGYTIRTSALDERQYEIEGVNVYRIALGKIIPHSRYSERGLQSAMKKILSYCSKKQFKPEAIICHWANPNLDLMYRLKNCFSVPTCYVAHGSGHFEVYGEDAKKFWGAVDVIGYRSDYIKREFEISKEWIKPSFMCYSGIPASFSSNTVERTFENINNVLYVGTLIKRKYPAQIIPALYNTFGDDFSMSYVGEGNERQKIEKLAKSYNLSNQVVLYGRLKREEVLRLMDSCTLFIMISEAETFGLVYLEAMARGCITIASRKEGFDGIIQHGMNGFLCEAGNSDELTMILQTIKGMTPKERRVISQNAMVTAKKLTDENVANDYLSNVLKMKTYV